MRTPKNFAFIETVEPEGEMFLATISFKTHGACITAIGSNLDECVRRAVIICDAFIKEPTP